VGKSLGADESGLAQGVQEAVAEEFDGWTIGVAPAPKS
jgi:hypothetical protein